MSAQDKLRLVEQQMDQQLQRGQAQRLMWLRCFVPAGFACHNGFFSANVMKYQGLNKAWCDLYLIRGKVFHNEGTAQTIWRVAKLRAPVYTEHRAESAWHRASPSAVREMTDGRRPSIGPAGLNLEFWKFDTSASARKRGAQRRATHPVRHFLRYQKHVVKIGWKRRLCRLEGREGWATRSLWLWPTQRIHYSDVLWFGLRHTQKLVVVLKNTGYARL